MYIKMIYPFPKLFDQFISLDNAHVWWGETAQILLKCRQKTHA